MDVALLADGSVAANGVHKFREKRVFSRMCFGCVLGKLGFDSLWKNLIETAAKNMSEKLWVNASCLVEAFWVSWILPRFWALQSGLS
jgi:hypothetical protein